MTSGALREFGAALSDYKKAVALTAPTRALGPGEDAEGRRLLARNLGAETAQFLMLVRQKPHAPAMPPSLVPHTATAHCHLRPALCGTRLTACRVRQVSTTPGAAPELLPELGAFVAANNSAVSPAVRARERAAHADGQS